MPKHHSPLILHVDHHGPGPLDQLPSEQLFAIVHSDSDCDCYTMRKRTQAWETFQQRPDFDLIMWNAQPGR